MKSPNIDPTISLGSLVSWALILATAVGTFAVASYRLDVAASENASQDSDIRELRVDLNSIDGRTIRLETQMNTIIDQQRQILAELRRNP